jgi:hypothetical protein
LAAIFAGVTIVTLAEGEITEQLKKERATAEKRIRRIVEAIAEGVPARSLKHELLALKRRQEELEREIARTAEPQHLLHPNLAELYRQKVAALEEALADPDDGAGAMEKIRALVDLVLLTPEGRKAAHRPDRRAGRHLEHRPERPKAPSKGRGPCGASKAGCGGRIPPIPNSRSVELRARYPLCRVAESSQRIATGFRGLCLEVHITHPAHTPTMGASRGGLLPRPLCNHRFGGDQEARHRCRVLQR